MLAWVTYTKPLTKLGLPFHPIPPLIVSHAIFAYLALIMSRYHYTIDVAIAVVLALFIWILLHVCWTNTEIQKYWVVRLVKRLDDHTMPEPEQSVDASTASLIPHRPTAQRPEMSQIPEMSMV